MRSHWSTSAPGTGPRSMRPALLTRMSSRPKRSTVACTAAVAFALSMMSLAMASAVPPACSISETRASSRSFRRATTATAAPSAASARAVACPMPLLAPVTRAIVPVRRDDIWVSGLRFLPQCLSRQRRIAVPPLGTRPQLRPDIDLSEHRSGNSCALHPDPSEAVFDLLHVGGGQLNLERIHVLLHVPLRPRPRNGHDPRLAGEQPGECNLGRRRLLARSHALQQFDDGPVRAPGFGREAGKRRSQVVGAKRRHRGDGASQIPDTEGTPRHEADAQLLAGRENFQLRIACPDGVFVLHRRDRLHFMRAANGCAPRTGQAEMTDLALADQRLDRPGHVLDGHRGIDAMLIE